MQPPNIPNPRQPRVRLWKGFPCSNPLRLRRTPSSASSRSASPQATLPSPPAPLQHHMHINGTHPRPPISTRLRLVVSLAAAATLLRLASASVAGCLHPPEGGAGMKRSRSTAAGAARAAVHSTPTRAGGLSHPLTLAVEQSTGRMAARNAIPRDTLLCRLDAFSVKGCNCAHCAMSFASTVGEFLLEGALAPEQVDAYLSSGKCNSWYVHLEMASTLLPTTLGAGC